MPDNQFRIVITAVDKATAVVKGVNESFSRLTRPIAMIHKSVSAFAKEAGVDRIGKSLVSVARAAGDVGEKLTRIAAPLAAVAGIGSIAGVAALAKGWAELGAEIGRQAATIGVSAQQLQLLSGAAQLMGGSAESLTGGLKTLGNTLEDAVAGRNADAASLMSRLGIAMHRTASGAPDVVRAFNDIADAIQRSSDNPQVQDLIARTFGLEDLLPLLRKGKAGIAELEEQVRRSGAVMSDRGVAVATAFQKSLIFLGLAFEGVKNSIAEQLLPAVQPLVDSFREWLIVNRDWLALKVKEAFIGIRDALASVDWKGVATDIRDIASGIGTVVSALGGWKTMVVAMAALMGGSLIASFVNAGIAIASFGAILLTTPVGWFLGAVGLIALAGYEIYEHWDGITAWFRKMWDDLVDLFEKGWAKVKPIVDAVKGAADWIGRQLGAAGSAADTTGRDRFGRPINKPYSGATGTWSEAPGAGGPSARASHPPAPLGRTGSLPPSVAQPKMSGATGAWGASPATAAMPAVAQTATAPVVGAAPSVATQASGPIGVRQNNPGNLRAWGNAPVVGGFAAFATPEQGLSAMAGNLHAYGGQGKDTIRQIVSTWAPASDNNDVNGYIADVSRRTGFAPDQTLDLNDPKTMSTLMGAMIAHEQGQQPYSAAMIEAAAQSRLAGAGQGAMPAAAAPVQDMAAAAQSRLASADQEGPPATAAPIQDMAMAGLAEVRVTVSFENAPAGIRTRTQKRGPVALDTRIGYAMAGAATI